MIKSMKIRAMKITEEGTSEHAAKSSGIWNWEEMRSVIKV